MINFQDTERQNIIKFYGGSAFVHAAAGCGKSTLFQERILFVKENIPLDNSQMLCISNSNQDCYKIKQSINQHKYQTTNLFIGSMLRFCINFLYRNKILHSGFGMMDDGDRMQFIRQQNIMVTRQVARSMLYYSDLILEQMYTIPHDLYLHTNATAENQGLGLTYHQFKEEYNLVDKDQILIMTYYYLSLAKKQGRKIPMSQYSWIQVDDVQNIKPLELAIIELLRDVDATIVFFGNENQSIEGVYSSNIQSINKIKLNCRHNTFQPKVNYRNSVAINELLCDFSRINMGVPTVNTPISAEEVSVENQAYMVECNIAEDQKNAAFYWAKHILNNTKEENIAILVNSNRQANDIAEIFDYHQIEYFSIASDNIFANEDYKLIINHLSIIFDEFNIYAWTRMLHRIKAVESFAHAKRCAKKMSDIGLTPLDLMNYDDSSYLIEFQNVLNNKELVIFSIRTNSEDIFQSDILQISAIKLLNGNPVKDSELDIIIQSEQEISVYLEDGSANPMLKEYLFRQESKEFFYTVKEGFEIFLEYIGEADLLSFNADIEVNTLLENIKRRAKQLTFKGNKLWDIGKILRLIHPKINPSLDIKDVVQHILNKPISTNTAKEDVWAIKLLARYSNLTIKPLIEKQRDFLAHPVCKNIQKVLREVYLPLYEQSKNKLFATENLEENNLVYDMVLTYNYLLEKQLIQPIKYFSTLCLFLNNNLLDYDKEKYFYQQLSSHHFELQVFEQRDFFNNAIINSRVNILTINQAQGLEFDHVIILDASEKSEPRAALQNNNIQARLLYSAISKARKDVYLIYSKQLTSEFTHPEIQQHLHPINK